ncbi:hypothetical protein [Spirochaeta isovalerica]|uniref:Lipoprotein n=1 Tax=Spirochaeta isovalerica TaxID=150 RepID=A0A841RIF1_9SPIO|nr:hypothetical protein [Spirochaeta isovalerica]MBB6482082.1 hypothetical protein [Spirochaeta isovalerica]
MKKIFPGVLFLLSVLFIGCSASPDEERQVNKVDFEGQIFLYGESHGVEKILNEEFKIWNGFYRKGMRHLFLEMSYFTAEYLNVWMGEDGDEILEDVYSDWEGTASHNEYTLNFFKNIKENCPGTIFHGTDVGHQYDSTAPRYLKYLKSQNLENSDNYKLTQEAVAQGIEYYQSDKNSIYRENTMVDNFLRELKSLDNQDIMGIYGSAHTGLDKLNHTGDAPSMANQLNKALPGKIISTNLTYLLKDIDPLRTDLLSINGKEYTASYFGKEDLKGFKDIDFREFWRLENAFDDFKKNKKTGDVLPYDNYPMLIDLGEIYLIKYKMMDGDSMKLLYISDGRMWRNEPATENISYE